MRRLTVLALSALLLAALAGCGDDDDVSEATDDAPEIETLGSDDDTPTDDDGTDGEGSENDEPVEASGGAPGSAGTVTVDGTTYPMDGAQQCDTSGLDVDGVEREPEVQIWGASDDGRVQLDVYVQAFSGMPSYDVSWAGPEGIFGGGVMQLGGGWTDDNDQTYADAPVSVDGNRTTGSLTLYDAMTMSESIDIDFDVTFPETLTSCR